MGEVALPHDLVDAANGVSAKRAPVAPHQAANMANNRVRYYIRAGEARIVLMSSGVDEAIVQRAHLATRRVSGTPTRAQRARPEEFVQFRLSQERVVAHRGTAV